MMIGSDMSSSVSDSPELPSDPEEVQTMDVSLPGQHRCCQFGCLDYLDEHIVHKCRMDELRMALASESNRSRKNEFQFSVLKELLTEPFDDKQQRKFKFMDINLCRNAAASLLDTSGPRLTRWVKWIVEGHSAPPQDRRTKPNVTLHCLQ